jgi:hypothetical protein
MKATSKTTTDIYLAAAFLCFGAKLTGVDYSEPKHVKFSFKSDKDLALLEQDFDNGELVGSLSNFAESLRKIKNKLYLEI